ncbi:DUF982 domain-containing protein [Aquamicrobium ahrensii]|uniref:DUF982 domain-containing protein n=1 Tax=Aquamicrobium ahrensii TaxID=469551 RepID=A0ABV2KQU2_9HYPH
MQWFTTSIWVRQEGLDVLPLETVEGAREYLDEWRADRRTPLFYAASNKIDEALKGSISPGEARSVVMLFLKEVDALGEATID